MNEIGQRTGVTTSGTAFPNLPSWFWGYDSLGQVTNADSSVATNDRSYQYDSIGNRKKTANSLTLPTSDNYTSNALNQYSAIQEGGAGVSPVYDDDGNATAYPLPVAPNTNSTPAWDAENRLISSTVGSVTTTYAYDAYSRRIAKSTGSSSTLYLYDDWNCIAEYEGGTGVSPVLKKTRLWGTDLSGTLQGAGGVGGLLAESSLIASNPITFNTFYPTYDGNGNVSEYLNSTGQVTAHFEYDPFGNTVVNTDSSNQFAYRFSTKPLDSGTGLYYYGYRYYDPATGRWPLKDPIEERGGVNLYGCVGNDAINYYDFLGLATTFGNNGEINNSTSLCCAGNEPKEKDEFGGECCKEAMVTVTIYTSPAGSSNSGSSSSGGKNVGHTYTHHPNVGYRGNYPSGYEDESKHGHPNKDDEKSKELKACPEAAKKIEDDMRAREKAGKNYGIGPGGKPNCTEAACDIMENAGHDMPNDWTPGGLHGSLQKQ